MCYCAKPRDQKQAISVLPWISNYTSRTANVSVQDSLLPYIPYNAKFLGASTLAQKQGKHAIHTCVACFLNEF
ncbi:hypothetical protein CON70_06750 [Bacillus pseudomycoides]|nr:hypothetical protein BLX05_28935 [Bacillus pseudomycoides]PDY11430.1 hypothetical protein COO16_15590 [Bacillus pseudomycoides]PDZ12334.1 hypothetical protein CON70_06750 [Bacillus pseudomycoides]